MWNKRDFLKWWKKRQCKKGSTLGAKLRGVMKSCLDLEKVIGGQLHLGVGYVHLWGYRNWSIFWGAPLKPEISRMRVQWVWNWVYGWSFFGPCGINPRPPSRNQKSGLQGKPLPLPLPPAEGIYIAPIHKKSPDHCAKTPHPTRSTAGTALQS